MTYCVYQTFPDRRCDRPEDDYAVHVNMWGTLLGCPGRAGIPCACLGADDCCAKHDYVPPGPNDPPPPPPVQRPLYGGRRLPG